ncbi:MAG: hypothetical protein FWD79_12595 [Desulfobulbus sp.]|nr:hypothetical protein [Desulfobulbus sp.]
MPCANGVIDLKTGALINGRPEDRLTKVINVEYDPTADYQKWHDFVAEVSGSEEKAKFSGVNWVNRSLKREQEKPTRTSIADHSAARENLREVVARIAAVYLPDQEIDGQKKREERFKTRQEAWEWIIAQGGKVSQGKFYQDAKAGLYRVYPDKTVSRVSVAEYLLRLKGASPAPDLELIDYTQEIRREQLRKLRMENERLERAGRFEDREWMRQEDHCAALAAILATLRDNLYHHSQRSSVRLVHAVGGDVNAAAQLEDRIRELVIGPAYNDLTGQKITEAVFAKAEEDEDDGDED